MSNDDENTKIKLTGNDYYDRSPCLKYTLITWQAIWILVLLAAGVLMTNASFRVDICEPAGGPCTGAIYTDQWSSIAWVAVSLFAINGFFYMSFQFILTFGRNRICAGIWIFILILCWLAGFVSWVLLLGQYVNCNKPKNPSNICTSLEACLVPEFFNDISSRCPNSPFGARAYTLQLDQLAPRADFMWLFGTTSAFVFVLNLVVVIVVFIMWCGLTNVKRFKLKSK